MKTPLTVENIKYICRFMLNVRWGPSFIGSNDQSSILRILSKCESKLEIMYLLGIGYYLHIVGQENGTSDDFPWWRSYKGFSDKQEDIEGIWFLAPWSGFRNGGPSAMLVVPQYLSPHKPIHHDFGIFMSGNDGLSGSPWHLFSAVEIEGYAIHKKRRAADQLRYSELPYKLFSLQEELTEPLTWFRAIDDFLQDQTERMEA